MHYRIHMTKTHDIEYEDEIMTVRFLAEPKLVDFYNAADDMDKSRLSRLRLWDLSCGVNLTNDEIYKLAEHMKSIFDKPSNERTC